MGGKKITTYTKVVIEKGSTDWIVECQHCRGSGQKYPGYGDQATKSKKECPTCGGKGANRISIKNSEGLYKCQHCRGSGQKYPGYRGQDTKRKHQCPTCDGHGVLALATERLECENCDGTGQKYPGYRGQDTKRKHQCKTCKGTGSNKI